MTQSSAKPRRIRGIFVTALTVTAAGVAILLTTRQREVSSKAAPAVANMKIAEEAVATVQADLVKDFARLEGQLPASAEMAALRNERIKALLDKDLAALLRLAAKLETMQKLGAARDVLRDAAKLGDVGAKLRLAHYEANGFGGKPNIESAVHWYEDAANSGRTNAYAKLARLFSDGHLTKPDPARASTYLDKGAAAGDPESMFIKGAKLLDQGDTVGATALLRLAAEKNNPEAQYLLSQLHADGKIPGASAAQAEQWARSASRNGVDGADVHLARLLVKHGASGKTNADAVREAADLLARARSRNNAEATLELAKLTLLLPNLEGEDLVAARLLAQEADRQGSPEAPFAFAFMSGDGNSNETRFWLQKGSLQNEWRSKYALALSADGLLPQADAIRIAATADFADYVENHVKQNARSGMIPPVPLSMTPPKYPEELRAMGVQGTVMAEFVVGSDGKPGAITILSSPLPQLERVVREAIASWQFKPALKEGVAVARKMRIPVSFEKE